MAIASEPALAPAPRAAPGASGAQAASPRLDAVVLALVLAGLTALYAPTYWDLLYGRWGSFSQGHEAIVLVVSGWLVLRQQRALAALPNLGATPGPAMALLGIGLAFYLFGRTQQFVRIELLSQLPVLAALLVGFRGWAALRLIWFALFFLLFVIPLPYSTVLALTAPLKAAVSAVAAQLLFWLDYPIGRSGVVITIGQYQLLVAEACAGLQTMFTLEALGLLYTNLMGYRSWLRNALLAVLVVPVAFCSNVVRVVVLVLVTYYFGDAVGQGFIHGFAGMLLFFIALMFIMATDRLLGWALPERHAR